MSMQAHGGGITGTADSVGGGELGGKMSNTARGWDSLGTAVMVLLGELYGEPVSVR